MSRPRLKEIAKAIEARGGIDWIMSEVENGNSLTRITRELGLEPAQRTWISTIVNSPEHKERYLEAKRKSAEVIEEKIADIVDTTTPENAQASRVQIDGLKWLAIIRDREQYGDKQGPLIQINNGMEMLNAMRKRTVDITPQIEAAKDENNAD